MIFIVNSEKREYHPIDEFITISIVNRLCQGIREAQQSDLQILRDYVNILSLKFAK